MNTQLETISSPAAAASGSAGKKEAKQPAPFCLIIDDEKSLRDLIARSLRHLMVMTEECGDASSALRAVKSRAPDLIFLAVSLERSDAVEVILGLAEIHFAGSVQLMSGRDLPLLEDIKRVGEGYGLKMLPVLQKPFRVDVIPGILHEAGMAERSGRSPQIGLFEALCAGWLELCYQPKFDLRRMQIVGAEGFARINHPEHGILTPAEFLPGTEDARLLSLTEFGVSAALHDWSEFADVGTPMRLSINVPVSALVKLPIAALVRDGRPKSSDWPGLILEITEEQALRDIKLVYELAAQLSIHNIHLAIDRFGHAHPSLTALLELPHVEVKLDPAFVSGCAEDPIKRQLCESVTLTAHKYKRQVAAVGIERREDAQALTQMGCDLGQGMLLGPPMPKEKLRQMMKTRMKRKPGG